MKITTTITVEVERPDGSFTSTTEQREHHCGDNPTYEPVGDGAVFEALLGATSLAAPPPVPAGQLADIMGRITTEEETSRG